MKILNPFLVFILAALAATTCGAAESKSNWQAEWERTVQAAKIEGSLSLYLYQGEGELGAMAQLFQKKYPEINVVVTPGRGNTFAPKIMAERRAGKYLVDVYTAGVTTAYEVFYRAKILDSVRAALILPEVVDESKWWQGQHQYVDPENRYILLYLGNVGEYVSYNTKLVDAGEIRSYWDFLQPKWKGKILSRDPKISGSQRIGLRMYYHTPELGAEFIRRLYGEMDVTLTQEIRQATDWLANGKFSICFFCSEILKSKAQGLPVDEFRTSRWKDSRAISAGNMGSIVMPNQPPHPNAARVFVNWLLSREGQTALQRAANTPYNSEESLRTDIPKDMVRSEVRRIDGVKYILVDKPEYMDMAPIQDIVEKALAAGKKR
ncbi:MAG TPA: extracellular solute-binding protein [Candidatus Limnocylindrales bacterium]|nr:extracellular solute-binding protein [Candidatus Limnocylindrales bacterium]